MASAVGCRLRFSEVINQVGRIAKGTLLVWIGWPFLTSLPVVSGFYYWCCSIIFQMMEGNVYNYRERKKKKKNMDRSGNEHIKTKTKQII
jgi:hypothetical protein